jgi:hypothetical protein
METSARRSLHWRCLYAKLFYQVPSITAANFCWLLAAVVPSECETTPASFISSTLPVTLASRILILSSSLPSSPSLVTRLGWMFSWAFAKGSRRVCNCL